jgi:uncharacterized membrane protein (UPF0136 family)
MFIIQNSELFSTVRCALSSRPGRLSGHHADRRARSQRLWVVSAVLGVATAVVDYLVHPGQFGPIAMEAVVTGVGAALLSYVVGTAVRRVRSRNPATG